LVHRVKTKVQHLKAQLQPLDDYSQEKNGKNVQNVAGKQHNTTQNAVDFESNILYALWVDCKQSRCFVEYVNNAVVLQTLCCRERTHNALGAMSLV